VHFSQTTTTSIITKNCLSKSRSLYYHLPTTVFGLNWFRYLSTCDSQSLPQCPLRPHRCFGQVARLPDNVPAHKTLNCQVNLSLGWPPSSRWHRHQGHPRNRWVDQIWRGTTTSHLQISGGVLSVVVTVEWRYDPCWLNIKNNNYELCHYIMLVK